MSANSLPDLLAENGIRPKSFRPGHTEKLICPKCGGGHTREASLSLTIDEDGEGAVWQCHRAKCGWSSGGKLRSTDGRVVPFTRKQIREPRRPVEHAPEVISRPAQMYDWFASRGISAETVDAFGCYLIRKKFPGLGERLALVFPYRYHGEVVNRKYRPPEKNPMMQEPDALPTLFNVDAITSPDVVCWVEGELDVMALHEAGYPQTVSLKDGAPAELRNEDDPRRETDRRFAALATHAELLESVGKFVLAGDQDEPGMVLREELARRLGKHRCWLVAWPEGCKDANDVLRTRGPAAVRDCIEAARPYPIDGVQDVTGAALDEFLQLPAPEVLSTGAAATDNILKIPGEGRLIVVTGLPNAGKSVWTVFLMVHLMRQHARRWLVFSPEMQPWQAFAIQCAQVLVGKPALPGRHVPAGTQLMSREERVQAGDWLHGRMSFLASDAEDVAPTLDWILERAQACVLRFGTTDLLIDPWNEIEHQRGLLSETDYIGRSLQRLRSFAQRHGCNVWVVVHPAKMQPPKSGDKLGPPGPYDIAGCYSSDTEVLTQRGWLPHKDVTLDDQVCCFDPTQNVLSYQRPSVVHKYNYSGPMHHYVGYSLDLLVTPNHRMLLQAAWDRPGKASGHERLGRPDTWSHQGWQFSESRDLKHAKYRMPMSAQLIAPNSNAIIPGIVDQDAAWAFVGWFVAEGWTSQNAPAVCQAAAANGEIRSVVKRLGIPFTEAIAPAPASRPNEQPMWRARILRRGSQEFCDWIIQKCGQGAANKRLPEEVWQLDRRTKQIIFDALIAGDGHQRPYDPNKIRQAGCVYATTSKRLAGEVQRLAIELGRYASANFAGRAELHHHDRYQVTIGHPNRTQRVIVIPRNRREVDYVGPIYCLTVPTGAYVTRRNGIMAICGNSANWSNKADLGLTIHTPDQVTQVHLWKSRFSRWGRKGSSAELNYDASTGRYSSCFISPELPDAGTGSMSDVDTDRDAI